MACDGYTKVWDLTPRELVLLDGARGTTLRVTRGRVWLTQERDHADVILTAGEAFTIERGGRTIVEAQEAATVCVLAHHVDAVRSRVRHPSLAHRVSEWLGSVGASAAVRRWVPYF
jgi:hypothetical protein